MCKAITKSGKVCKIKSKTRFCYIHRDQYDGVPEPTIEEKREAQLQKIFSHSPCYFSQREAWPLFKGLDFTCETLTLINRAKIACDWTEETYNTVISTFFDDSVDEDTKYYFFKQTMSEGMSLSPTKDRLKKIQRLDLYKDVTVLLTKIALSRGRYWEGILSARILIDGVYKMKKHDIETYRENNLNKLRVKEAKKHTPICDDVCNYIIAQYL